MTINLTKGGNVSLTQEAPGLTDIRVGLGWDEQAGTGDEFDLDASVFMLGTNDKLLSDQHFVFFNNLRSPDGSVSHSGDNLTGQGDGDDEVVTVNLPTVPLGVARVVFVVTIYEAPERGQNFGQVRNAFIRVVDDSTGAELVRYDLSEDFAVEDAVIFGELYRRGDEWKFRAVGQGHTGGLTGLIAMHQ